MSGDRQATRNWETVTGAVSGLGLDLLGSAHVGAEHRAGFHESIREIVSPLEWAVSIGIALSGPVLATVVTAPTWTYHHHYRQVNSALDQAALVISGRLQRIGYRAFPVPASQILDWDRLRAHLSHRETASLAGLGWRGRNNLLVTPRHGSMVRLATVLTDAPLPEPEAQERSAGCGSCRACIDVCPVGAIHDDPEEFDLDRCAAQLRRFSQTEKLNTMICGICVKACRGRGAGAPAAAAQTGTVTSG